MKSIETQVINYLLGLTELTDLVDNRIYPMQLAEKTDFPAIAYRRISTNKSNRARSQFLESVMIEFDIYGDSMKETNEIMEVMKSLIDGVSTELPEFGIVTFFERNVRDMQDVDIYKKRKLTEYEVSYGKKTN
jgi:hypothetical protein